MTPFLLRPVGRDYLWGGDRLNAYFQKNIPLSPLAETWECSVHPDGLTTVSGGEHDGMTLRDVLRAHPDYLGEGFHGELPIMVKLIDAKLDLSVQVHPDDLYARTHEGDNGKSEFWYILDAEEDACLIYGFREEVDEATVRAAAENGTLTDYLHRIPVRAKDAFYIPAGTVHAIGGGILLAEIQESSNVTYRVWDYDRRGKDGSKRPLHLAQALAVMDRHPAPTRTVLPIPVDLGGSTVTLLCDCPYFLTERVDVRIAHTLTVSDAFAVLLITEGEGMLRTQDGDALPCRRGDCFFCPAGTGTCDLTGTLTCLRTVAKPRTQV